MFAQLVGLPGSGKTTLAARLEHSWPDRVRTVDPQYRPILSLLGRHPLRLLVRAVPLLPVVAFCLLDRSAVLARVDRLRALATLLSLLMRYDDLRRAPLAPDVVYVFDEFVLQRALSLFGYARRAPPRWVVRFYLLALSDCTARTVLLDIEPRIALERAHSRVAGLPERMRSLDREQTLRVYEVQRELTERLRELLGDWIVVPSDGSVGGTAERIHQALTSSAGG